MKFAWVFFFKYNVLKEKWSYNINWSKKKVCKYNFSIRKGSVWGRAGKQLFFYIFFLKQI